MLYALRGTPFVYQGEELGLSNGEVPEERVVDVDGRDPARVPLPWDPPSVTGPGAGFTTGTPWLPTHHDAERLCAARQAGDPHSMLTLVQRLASVRAATPALQHGRQRTLDTNPDLLVWSRELDDDRLLVVANFDGTARPMSAVPDARSARVLLSTDAERSASLVDIESLTLAPFEAVLMRIAAS
jgi:alpha-glucosidase